MQKSILAAVILCFSAGATAQSVPSFQSDGGGSPNPAASELFFMVEQLRDEVRSLRGTIEEQQYQIRQLTEQSRDRYVDLDRRLLEVSGRVSELEGGVAAGSGLSGGPAIEGAAGNGSQVAGPSATAPEPVTFRQPNNFELQTYKGIQEKIRAKNYPAAINDLYQFISDYPEGDLTVNAYYWLGEVYLAQSEFDQARQAFTIVTARFPTHRKAADGLYKLGIVHDRLNEKAEARSTMNEVVQRYPQTDAAGLATQYLNQNPG